MARTTGGDREKDVRRRDEIPPFNAGSTKKSKPKSDKRDDDKPAVKSKPKKSAPSHSAAKEQSRMANKLLDALISLAAAKVGPGDWGPGSPGLSAERYEVPRYGTHRRANLNVGPLSAEIATRRGGLPGGYGEGERPGQRVTGSVDWNWDDLLGGSL